LAPAWGGQFIQAKGGQGYWLLQTWEETFHKIFRHLRNSVPFSDINTDCSFFFSIFL